jgi:hypothetical protein
MHFAAPHAAVRGARLPLAFIVFGIGCLAHALGCLVWEPALILQPHISPRVLSLVHAWVPGFLVSVCLGACYQMMPVVLGVPLACGAWRTWTHLALHAVGVTILISGFTRGLYELVVAGGVLVSLGIVSFAQVAWRTFATSERRDAVAWSFPISATWLLATVVFGVVIAIERRWGLLGLPTLRLLPVHAHMGLAGFFLTLLQGVSFQLVPMFTMGEPRRPRFMFGGLVASQAGLVCLASGLVAGLHSLALVGGCVLAGGVASSGVAFVATLRSRRRKKLEPSLVAFVCGAALIPVTAIFGMVLLTTRVADEFPSLVSAYGLVIIAGALSLVVLGMLGKIVPFLVWMTAYGPKVGKERVPAAPTLSSRELERTWIVAHVAGVVLAVAAVWIGSGAAAKAAAWTLSVGGTLYLWNFARTARHLVARWRPVCVTQS